MVIGQTSNLAADHRGLTADARAESRASPASGRLLPPASPQADQLSAACIRRRYSVSERMTVGRALAQAVSSQRKAVSRMALRRGCAPACGGKGPRNGREFMGIMWRHCAGTAPPAPRRPAARKGIFPLLPAGLHPWLPIFRPCGPCGHQYPTPQVTPAVTRSWGWEKRIGEPEGAGGAQLHTRCKVNSVAPGPGLDGCLYENHEGRSDSVRIARHPCGRCRVPPPGPSWRCGNVPMDGDVHGRTHPEWQGLPQHRRPVHHGVRLVTFQGIRYSLFSSNTRPGADPGFADFDSIEVNGAPSSRSYKTDSVQPPDRTQHA